MNSNVVLEKEIILVLVNDLGYGVFQAKNGERWIFDYDKANNEYVKCFDRDI